MKNERRSTAPRYVMLYYWELDCEAFRSLDPYGRALLIEFKKRYNGLNNGAIAFSLDEMEAALQCSNKPAARALRQLIDRGFVKLSRKGSFDWKARRGGGGRASTWILTEYSIDFPIRSAMPATKDFMKWRDPAKGSEKAKPQKKTRGDEGIPLGCSGHPMKDEMGCREHPNGMTRAPHFEQIEGANGVTRAPTYSVPDGGAVSKNATRPQISVPPSSNHLDTDVFPIALDEDDASQIVTKIFADRGIPLHAGIAATMCSQMLQGVLTRCAVDTMLDHLESQFREAFEKVHNGRVDPHFIDPPEDTLFAD